MNRIDWQGNPGDTIRRGEIFEIDDPDRIKTWVDAGYVSIVESEDGVDDTTPESPPATETVISVDRYDDRKWDNIKDTSESIPVEKGHKKIKKAKKIKKKS